MAVVDAPVIGANRRVEEALDATAIHELGAQAAVDGVEPFVLPGAARLDEDGTRRVNAESADEREGDDLRSVVEADVGRCAAIGGGALEAGRAPSTSIECSTSQASASQVDSSTTFDSLNILPSLVWLNRRSRAQIAFGRIEQNAPTATPMPRGDFLRLRQTTRSAVGGPSPWRRLWFALKSALVTSTAARQPQRGRRPKSRRNARSASSLPAGTGVARRWVEEFGR